MNERNNILKLNVSFKELHAAVKLMGVPPVDDFVIDAKMSPRTSIDIELEKGIEIELKDVEYGNGLLSYKGCQILLYIQDHSHKDRNVSNVLKDGSKGNKYHIADCEKLQDMRAGGRFERYVATNNLSPDFFISGKDWETGEKKDGKTQLCVCKLCLKKLNYKGYGCHVRREQSKIFSDFDLEVFFSAYNSFFDHLPVRFAGLAAVDGYVEGWERIAGKYKTSRRFVCEECGLDLSKSKNLLHAHHVNGVKTDNRHSNLKALCVECHRAQPCHGHMFVSHEDRKKITSLRRRQGKLEESDWDEIIKIADPGVEGLLRECSEHDKPIPKVGYEVRDGENRVIAELALAWPKSKYGVAISMKNLALADLDSWQVHGVTEALDRLRCHGNTNSTRTGRRLK